jgi:DNA-binding winged helix-turn-helix (wHTH) protein
MKVLFVASKPVSKGGFKALLEKSKIYMEEAVIDSFEVFKKDFPALANGCAAVIFDRFYFPISDCQSLLAGMDCFFIIDNYEDVKKFGVFNKDFTFRFYFWPLNYNLILDDLKSVTRIKEYMDFGEIALNELELSLNKRALVKGEVEVYLKNKEFELLLYLARNRGKVLSRGNILENVWDMNSTVLTNTVDVHISRLRRILKAHFGLVDLIRTVPCSGYILVQR